MVFRTFKDVHRIFKYKDKIILEDFRQEQNRRFSVKYQLLKRVNKYFSKLFIFWRKKLFHSCTFSGVIYLF